MLCIDIMFNSFSGNKLLTCQEISLVSRLRGKTPQLLWRHYWYYWHIIHSLFLPTGEKMWLTLLSGITLICSAQQSQQRISVSSSIVTISAQDFVASRFPWGTNFTGTNPLPDKAGQSCGKDLGNPSMDSVNPCSYLINDSYLSQTIPGWVASKGAMATRPWTNGFSSPRLLGGLATHNPNTNTWTPDLDFEVVRRSSDGKTLLYNWTRIDSTLDGYVAAKTERFLIVLDNIPFAFVKPENRFYLSYGLGSAPDDPQEFAIFVGKFAEHLVGRYGLKTVSKWRFRLGTECDGLYSLLN